MDIKLTAVKLKHKTVAYNQHFSTKTAGYSQHFKPKHTQILDSSQKKFGINQASTHSLTKYYSFSTPK